MIEKILYTFAGITLALVGYILFTMIPTGVDPFPYFSAVIALVVTTGIASGWLIRKGLGIKRNNLNDK